MAAMISAPLAIDLCCGKGGWTRGLIDAGFRVIGFDVIAYPQYPADLVLVSAPPLGASFRAGTSRWRSRSDGAKARKTRGTGILRMFRGGAQSRIVKSMGY